MRDLSKNKNIEFIDELQCTPSVKIKCYKCRAANRLWLVTASREFNDYYNCWFEHLCMSDWNKKAKYIPNWKQIIAVKREFFNPNEECIHFIPRESEYVNLKENAMHIFHPLASTDIYLQLKKYLRAHLFNRMKPSFDVTELSLRRYIEKNLDDGIEEMINGMSEKYRNSKDYEEDVEYYREALEEWCR